MDKLQVGIYREVFKRSFYEFFKYFWSTCESAEFKDNYHIKYLCDTLQRRFKYLIITTLEEQYHMTEDDLYDLVINMCPGSSKSLIVSVMFPCWILLVKPTMRILNTSYSFTIAEQLSAKRLKILQSDTYRAITYSKLTSTAIKNVTNGRGGQIYITSTDGSITGVHFDVLIHDDPNHPSSMYSQVKRIEADRFVNEICPSRRSNPKRSLMIVVQQRFHTNDVSSTWIGKKRVKHIMIPAITQTGESFFPDRFDLQYFEEMKESLGAKSFNAQYLQRTEEEGGGIIKNEWLRIEDFFWTEHRKLTYFVDTSYGGKNADYNAICCAYVDNHVIYICKLGLNKLEFPEFLKYIRGFVKPKSKLYIENKASGKSIVQVLKKETWFNVVEINSHISKTERKHSCSPFFEAGRVVIHDKIEHKEELIEQLIFDNTKHDDALDVVMYAIEYLTKGGSRRSTFRF